MILVDSDVLIEHLRGNAAAQRWLESTRRTTGRMGLSVISVVEVAGGMRQRERHDVLRLLSSMVVFPVHEHIAWQAAELMRTHRSAHGGITIADYLIAATADVEGLELATLNVRHFPMFPGLKPPFAV